MIMTSPEKVWLTRAWAGWHVANLVTAKYTILLYKLTALYLATVPKTESKRNKIKEKKNAYTTRCLDRRVGGI